KIDRYPAGCRTTRVRSAGRAGIGLAPTPCTRAEAACYDALAIDVRHHVAIAGQQRLRRAHLRAERQLALGEAIAAVLPEHHVLVRLRAAGAEGALVHLAARAEVGR